MWHRMSFVAKEQFLDSKELMAFALANSNRYSIITTGPEPEVNTWNVDKLIEDFVAQGGRRLNLDEWQAMYPGGWGLPK